MTATLQEGDSASHSIPKVQWAAKPIKDSSSKTKVKLMYRRHHCAAGRKCYKNNTRFYLTNLKVK